LKVAWFLDGYLLFRNGDLKTRLESRRTLYSAWFQPLHLKCGSPGFKFCFFFKWVNLYRYSTGAFKAPGACRPRPDSLNLEHGTAVVGATWGAESPEVWRPGHPAATGRSDRTEKMLAPRPMHHNNHTPWGHTELPERGADHGGAVQIEFSWTLSLKAPGFNP
jgi:hypothetical protein